VFCWGREELAEARAPAYLDTSGGRVALNRSDSYIFQLEPSRGAAARYERSTWYKTLWASVLPMG